MALKLENFVLYHARWKMGIVSAFSGVCTIAFIGIIIKSFSMGIGDAAFALLLGVPLIALFVGMLRFGLKNLPQNSPALLVNEDGIVINTQPFSPGFIHWQEIARVRVEYYGMYRAICIDLKDQKAYLTRFNLLHRSFLASMKTTWKTPVVISSIMLSSSDMQVSAILDEHLKAYWDRWV